MSEPSREVVERAARALHADWDTYPNVVFQDDVRRDIRIVLEASGLIEERDALRDALRIYGRHKTRCTSELYTADPILDCDCGFARALRVESSPPPYFDVPVWPTDQTVGPARESSPPGPEKA